MYDIYKYILSKFPPTEERPIIPDEDKIFCPVLGGFAQKVKNAPVLNFTGSPGRLFFADCNISQKAAEIISDFLRLRHRQKRYRRIGNNVFICIKAGLWLGLNANKGRYAINGIYQSIKDVRAAVNLIKLRSKSKK